MGSKVSYFFLLSVCPPRFLLCGLLLLLPQISDLLSEKRVQEALNLAQVTVGRPDQELDADEFERQQQVGL